MRSCCVLVARRRKVFPPTSTPQTHANEHLASHVTHTGWHWVEKDCLEWSKQRLSSLLGAQVLADTNGVRVTAEPTVQSLTGEAFVNQRKGKLIPSYELELKLEWSGVPTSEAGGETAKGTVHVPYIADENAGDDADELEVRVSAQADDALSRACKAAVQKFGVPKVRAAVKQWVKDMASGGPGGAAAAAAASTAAAAAPPAKASASVPASAQKEAAPETKKQEKAGFATITLTERFYCRPADIFEALTHPGRVRAFTQSDCEVSAAPGAAFSLFGGNIHGENGPDMAGPNRISQKWRFRNWPDGVFSNLVMDLTEPEHGVTVLRLTQTGVPVADKFGNETVVDTTRDGWRQNFFDRIRKVFGFGA